MVAADLNIPLILACMAFLAICLLCVGILTHLSQVREKREMFEKIRADENEWIPVEPDADTLEKAKKSGGPFVDFLRTMGLRAIPGKSKKGFDTLMRI